jgi:hypothetical protein
MSTQTLVELVQERPDVSREAAPLLPLQGSYTADLIIDMYPTERVR